METLFQDLRYGFRMLARNPGFTAVAVITLALGIGANTAIFSVINAVLLERLPFPDPDRVVFVQEATKTSPGFTISVPNFDDYRQQQRTFEDLSFWVSQSVNLTGVDRPDRVIGSFVSADFFRTIGIKPAQGRFFLSGEDRPGDDRAVVVSYGFWQDRFGGDPNLLGKQLTLNGEPYTLVGILPRGLTFLLVASDVYMTIQHYPNYRVERSEKDQLVIGRIKEGVSRAAAAADLNVTAQRLARDYPKESAGIHVELLPVKDMQVAGIRPALLILLAAAGAVLLIACANLANLLLARGIARSREIAVRAALGASRARIVRQLLVESVLIAAIGGVAGALISIWGLDALLKLSPIDLPLGATASLDVRVFIFALALSVITGVVFGLVPAFKLSRPNLTANLSAGGRSTDSLGHNWLRSAFVVSQIAMSALLLIGAVLLLRSFRSLLEVNPGFDTRNLLTMEYRLPKNKYPTPQAQWNFHREMLGRVKAVPGVVSGAIIQSLPFSGNGFSLGFWPASMPQPPRGEEPTALSNLVTPEYFSTVGMPILKGRNFDDQDSADLPIVVIINQSLARKYWPNEDAVGRELRFPGTQIAAGATSGPTRATVIGVVPDTKQFQVRDAFQPQVYFAYAQNSGIFGTLAVHAAVKPMSLSDAVRKAVWSVDKDQPVWKIRTMQSLMEQDVAPDRFVMVLMSLFGALALMLAAVGIYGVISNSVKRRTQEIGVRMALGARRGDVLRMIMRQGLTLTLIGVATGLAAALALTRFLASLLYGVRPTDPSTFAVVAVALPTVALLATYVPARRATKVDPMVALRYE